MEDILKRGECKIEGTTSEFYQFQEKAVGSDRRCSTKIMSYFSVSSSVEILNMSLCKELHKEPMFQKRLAGALL